MYEIWLKPCLNARKICGVIGHREVQSDIRKLYKISFKVIPFRSVVVSIATSSKKLDSYSKENLMTSNITKDR